MELLPLLSTASACKLDVFPGMASTALAVTVYEPVVELPDERLEGMRSNLAAACARVERDPATLTVTVGVTVRYPGAAPAAADSPALSGSPDEIAAGLAAHAAAGADHLIAALEPSTPETLAAFAEAVALSRE